MIAVEPGAVSWRTIVGLYGRHGTWCKTAQLIWPDGAYPTRLVAECEAARRVHLQQHGEPK